MQAHRKNMERMEETVVDAGDQNLQYMLTESDWDHEAVMDQVAKEVDLQLGGTPESCLLIDESSFAKKGKHSVGVARQWCGRLGKVDNCQVGVFAALGKGSLCSLVDVRLFLPREWISSAARCQRGGVPKSRRTQRSKAQLALDMVRRQRAIGVRFAWVGADGGYGKDPAFLRALEDMGEVFVVDIHKDQRIYAEDPQPFVPHNTTSHGRRRSRRETRTPAVRVDQWVAALPDDAWRGVKLRNSTQGPLQIDTLHRRIWLWDGKEGRARQWHLIVRREIDSPQTIKYTLSNAAAQTPAHRLAWMQAQRFWIERAFQDGKSEAGLADYQARKWSSWHHHMALVSMAMLFMLQERILHKDTHPLLSCSDIESLLRTFLPRRDIEHREVIRQLEKRHRRRQVAIEANYQKTAPSLNGLSVDWNSTK